MTDVEVAILEEAVHHGQPAYVRLKALALWHRAHGATKTEAARHVHSTRQSVAVWERRFGQAGLAGLTVKPGRGRKAKVDLEELTTYARQSPRQFGLALTRWTLQGLIDVVPSLKGYSRAGAWEALRRARLSYKRGQPWHHSPDPEYAAKKAPSRRRSPRRGHGRARRSSALRMRRPSTGSQRPPASGPRGGGASLGCHGVSGRTRKPASSAM